MGYPTDQDFEESHRRSYPPSQVRKEPTQPGLYWARWRGIEEPWKAEGEFSPTKVTKEGDDLCVKDSGGHGGKTCWPLKHFEWGEKIVRLSTGVERLLISDTLRYFQYEHLPERLAAISRPFCELAHQVASDKGLSGPEVGVCLRKLLEAKDCAVRAAVRWDDDA